MEKNDIWDLPEDQADYQGEQHYKGYKYEPVKFIMDMHFDFIQGNILKYLVRYPKKNGLKDLQKARHYAQLGYKLLSCKSSRLSAQEEGDKIENIALFVVQEQFDKPTQDFLSIAITLICNYQMKQLAHFIDMQMTVEYATHQH